MIPETQAFIFEMLLEPTLEAIKEHKDEVLLPVLRCPEEYLIDFVTFLRQERYQKIFKKTGYFPVIQICEKHLEEEVSNLRNGFCQSLILLSLLIRENPFLAKGFLISLRQESAEINERFTPKQLSEFLGKHIGFLLNEDKSNFN